MPSPQVSRFFFKTHYPHNRVVGGGFFSGSARLPMSEAWELFGAANGVDSADEMRERIGRYRRARIASGDDPVIGCLFVRDVRFFPEDASAPPLCQTPVRHDDHVNLCGEQGEMGSPRQ